MVHDAQLMGDSPLSSDPQPDARALAPRRPDLAQVALKAGAEHYSRNNQGAALAAWREALAADSGCLPAYLNIAKVLEEQGALNKAAEAYRGALDIASGTIRALRGLVRVEAGLGHFDRALAACDRIDELESGESWVINMRAWILERAGRLDHAYELILPAVRRHPGDAELAIVFGNICARLNPPSAQALPLLQAVARRPDLAQAQRREVLWSQAQLCDALGLHDEAFATLQRAKQLDPAPESHPRVLRARAVTAAALAAYTTERLARLPRAGHGSELPIFIVGMPRSGTTLAEQILASHPRVFGAGEQALVARIAVELLPRRAPYPRCLDELTQERVNRLAQLYLREMQRQAPGASRVVDKMMSNYEHLGLIQILFPAARVIHCVRHPLDTCLSMYFHDLAGMLENRDLVLLARRYRDYRLLMARWHEILDLPIFTLDYEMLVSEPEPTVRALVEFCGLEWDDGCLRFHETRRVVRTYSYHQVRKPLYRGSVGRYRAYEKHLEPIRAILGDLIDKADRARAVSGKDTPPHGARN